MDELEKLNHRISILKISVDLNQDLGNAWCLNPEIQARVIKDTEQIKIELNKLLKQKEELEKRSSLS